MALPDNLSYTKITGRFIRAVIDSLVDEDDLPGSVAISGLTITFTPDLSPARIKTMTSVPPALITVSPIVGTTNVDGDLVSPDGSVGIYIISSDDPDISPRGWTYKVTINGTGFPTIAFSFVAVSNTEMDLTTMIPVPANPGAEIILWQQLQAQAAAAAAAAGASASAAAGSASTAIDAAEDADADADASAASAVASAASATAAAASATAAAGSATSAASASTSANSAATIALNVQTAIEDADDAAIAAAAAAAASATAADASADAAEVARIAAEAAAEAAEGGGGGGGSAEFPPNGYRGAVLTQDVNGAVKWSTPIGSIVPKYYIYLEGTNTGATPEGDSTYEVVPFGPFLTDETAKTMLPTPLFEYGTGGPDEVSMDWPIAWADEHEVWGGTPELISDPMPIQLEIYINPAFEDQLFHISIPSSYMGSNGAPWYTVAIRNDGVFACRVDIEGDSLVYDRGIYRPIAYTDLPVDSFLSWKVTNTGFTGTAHVEPFWETAYNPPFGYINYPMDEWYWENVQSLSRERAFSYVGDLATSTGQHRMYHGGAGTVRIGKVTAAVGTVAVGADIQIQVKINGTTPIFATPLTLAAGSYYVESAPTAGFPVINSGYAFNGAEMVILRPGDYLTVDVIQTGTSAPGGNLTLQVYYG